LYQLLDTFSAIRDNNMTSFPADFHWGYATASAQVEGSVSSRPTSTD
jgi:hypothetical protein